MFHRNDEQIFVEVDLPCVLSVGKMLLLLIVDHRDTVTVGRDVTSSWGVGLARDRLRRIS